MANTYTKIPLDTATTLQMNAGIIVNEFDPETREIGTIEKATSGGITINIVPELQDFFEDIDNADTNTKEGLRITGWNVEISGTQITFSPEAVRELLGAADIDSEDSTHITLRNEIKDSDFKDKWWIGDYGTNGYMAVHFANLFSTSGLVIKSNNKDKGTADFTYKAYASVQNQGVVPVDVYVLKTIPTTTNTTPTTP